MHHHHKSDVSHFWVFLEKGLFPHRDNFGHHPPSILIGAKERAVQGNGTKMDETSAENSVGLVAMNFDFACSKCDGNHKDEDCPYFKKPRELHPDAARKQLLSSMSTKEEILEFIFEEIIPQKVIGSFFNQSETTRQV